MASGYIQIYSKGRNMGMQSAPVIIDGYINKQLLTDAYIDWLDEFAYDSFTTFTFRAPYKDYFSDTQVDSIFKDFMWRMNRRICGHHFSNRDMRVKLVYIIDEDAYDGKHIHTLIEQSDRLHNKSHEFNAILLHEWRKTHRSTGHIDYRTYDKNLRARAYLTGKDIYKGGKLCLEYFYPKY